jgi:hypothetical protein
VRLVNALAKEMGVYVGQFDPLSVAHTIREGQNILGLTKRDLAALHADVRMERDALER